MCAVCALCDTFLCCPATSLLPNKLPLQDQPPSACSQLLTSCAFRKLNVECLNRLAVNTFVDKQAAATPQDMASLMASLALVRCCSSTSSSQVRFLKGTRAHVHVLVYDVQVVSGLETVLRLGACGWRTRVPLKLFRVFTYVMCAALVAGCWL